MKIRLPIPNEDDITKLCGILGYHGISTIRVCLHPDEYRWNRQYGIEIEVPEEREDGD